MNHEEEPEPSNTLNDAASPDDSKARRGRITKHLSLVESLLKSLDITFFVQLSAIYYLDCRLATLFLRAFVQILTVSPRSPSQFQAPIADPTLQPVIGLLLSSNLVALFTHLVAQGNAATEVTYYYQHGGILVDFIGERTPVSKIKLVLLDVLVCTIQLIMLSATIEKTRLSKIQQSDSATAAAGVSVNPSGLQTHDAEERAVSAEAEDPLLSNVLAMEEGDRQISAHAHPLDSFTTGRHLIVDIDLSQTVQRQWRLWKNGTPTPATSSSSNATEQPTDSRSGLATLMGPFGFRVRVGGRNLGTT